MQSPVFVNESETLDILYPVFVEWVNLIAKMPLHEFASGIEVQIIDYSYDIMINRFTLSISDGVHWVKSRLDRNLNWLFNHGHVRIFEIIQIELTDGHPRTFNLELVSFFTFFIVSVIMFFIRLRSRGLPTTLGPPSTGLQSMWRTIWPGTQTARGNRLSLESRSCEHIHEPVS